MRKKRPLKYSLKPFLSLSCEWGIGGGERAEWGVMSGGKLFNISLLESTRERGEDAQSPVHIPLWYQPRSYQTWCLWRRQVTWHPPPSSTCPTACCFVTKITSCRLLTTTTPAWNQENPINKSQGFEMIILRLLWSRERKEEPERSM